MADSQGQPKSAPKVEKDTSSATQTATKKSDEDFGYYFFPERGGKEDKSLLQRMKDGRKVGKSVKCISNVYWCAKNNPMVKLLMGALKSHGCPVDLGRHVSCEECHSRVNGGFDPTTNQVVVCSNNSYTKGLCCSVLAHELTHMFDYCRAKLDFTNLEHLACTEIRAANLHHCSFTSSWLEGDSSMFTVKQTHKECVKRKAVMSVLMVRNVTHEEATKVVDKVFKKCYNDLEPVGRRTRRNSGDAYRALSEGYLYGYAD